MNCMPVIDPSKNDAWSSSEPTENNVLGRVVDGKYALLRSLDAGGWGTSYAGLDLVLEREVAIKMLHSAFAADSSLVERFAREALAVSGWCHPNIVPVLDYGVDGGTPFVVTECIEGETLQERMRSKSPLRTKALLRVAIDVVRALAAAHKLGVFHRDLKPENILLVKRGDGTIAKVFDFGIAVLSWEQHSERMACAFPEGEIVIGKERYAAPEGRRGLNIDGRADIYSLGVILYEALVGTLPSEENAIARGTKRTDTKRLPRHKRSLKSVRLPEFEAVIMKCLAPKREDRYETAAQLLKALETIESKHRSTPGHRISPRAMGAIGLVAMALTCATLHYNRGEPQAELLSGVDEMKLQASESIDRPLAGASTGDVPVGVVPVSGNATPELRQDNEGPARRLFEQAKESYRLQEYDQAASSLRAVVTERPTDVPAQLLLALSYKKLGQLDSAIFVLEGLNPSVPGWDRVAYQLAVLYAEMDKREIALAHLEAAVHQNSSLKEHIRDNPAFQTLTLDRRYERRLCAMVGTSTSGCAAQADDGSQRTL